MEKRHTILILENHADQAKLFGRYLAPDDVHYEVVRAYAGEELPVPDEYGGIIVSGGTMGVYEMDEPENAFLRVESDYLLEAVQKDVPVLGVCLGHQLLAHALGGTVVKSETPEYGWVEVTLTPAGLQDSLFQTVEHKFVCFQYHQDEVIALPEGAVRLGFSDMIRTQSFRYRDKAAWGIQFHPEYHPQKAEALMSSRREELGRKGIDVDQMIATGYEVFGSASETIFSNFVKVVLNPATSVVK